MFLKHIRMLLSTDYDWILFVALLEKKLWLLGIIWFIYFIFFEEEERTLGEVEVWVQGIRDANLTWRYHDSTQFNYTCLRGVTGEPTDNYMRARSAGNYNCNDHNEYYRSFFLCEIYIRDNWIWKEKTCTCMQLYFLYLRSERDGGILYYPCVSLSVINHFCLSVRNNKFCECRVFLGNNALQIFAMRWCLIWYERT